MKVSRLQGEMTGIRNGLVRQTVGPQFFTPLTGFFCGRSEEMLGLLFYDDVRRSCNLSTQGFQKGFFVTNTDPSKAKTGQDFDKMNGSPTSETTDPKIAKKLEMQSRENEEWPWGVLGPWARMLMGK